MRFIPIVGYQVYGWDHIIQILSAFKCFHLSANFPIKIVKWFVLSQSESPPTTPQNSVRSGASASAIVKTKSLERGGSLIPPPRQTSVTVRLSIMSMFMSIGFNTISVLLNQY